MREKKKKREETLFLFFYHIIHLLFHNVAFFPYFFINFVTREVLHPLLTRRLSLCEFIVGALKAMYECNVRMRKNPTSFSPRCKQTHVCCEICTILFTGDVVTTKWRDRSDSIDREREFTPGPSAVASEKSRYYLARAAKQWPCVCAPVTNSGIVKRTSIARCLDKTTWPRLFRKIEFDLRTRWLRI